MFFLLIFCFLPPPPLHTHTHTHTCTVQLFEYRRLVQLLLRLIEDREDGDDFVRRIAIYLLNSLACQVDGEQKMLVGDLGAIEVMFFLHNICFALVTLAGITIISV